MSQSNQSTSELLQRVRNGNDALSEVYLNALKLDDTSFERQMQRIIKSWPALDELCRQLMFKDDFRNCLYDGNCDRTPVCWVCPK